jgi:hypothetical protein
MILNGAQIPITKYNPSITKNLPDITDNGDYDSQTGLIYPTQLPVSAVTELSVEGRFHLNSTPISVMALLYSGVSAIPVTLGLDAGNLFGHGNFDISNFQAVVDVRETVTFTCTMVSNGKFTPSS